MMVVDVVVVVTTTTTASATGIKQLVPRECGHDKPNQLELHVNFH